MSERDQFEAWWEEWFGEAPMSGWDNLRTDSGYSAEEIDIQWEAWMGRASREALKAEQGHSVQPIAWLNDAYLARGVVDGEAGSEDAGPGYIPVYREPFTSKDDGWIACADRMPEVCANVIVTDGRDTGFMWPCSDGRWDSWHSGDSVSGNVTHWQPLPSPPAINHPIDTTPNQYDALGKGEK